MECVAWDFLTTIIHAKMKIPILRKAIIRSLEFILIIDQNVISLALVRIELPLLSFAH